MFDRYLIQDRLWVITEPVGVPVYDFDFRQFFDCRTPYSSSDRVAGIARIGAFKDYSAFYAECAEAGIDLVHTPDDHLRCSSLPLWYPLIENHTPRSRCYSEIPTFREIESEFGLPVFIKGARQTSKHSVAASVVRSREDFEAAISIFKSDPISKWQDFVCRELVDLRPVGGGVEGKIPASYEFRTFWWRGSLVGSGRYWFEAHDYTWTQVEKTEALDVAQEAVAALDCVFLVVDLAQKSDGEWIIIECNDGMESGYAGASPFAVWQRVLDIESARR